jgi:hypothetical protein
LDAKKTFEDDQKAAMDKLASRLKLDTVKLKISDAIIVLV